METIMKDYLLYVSAFIGTFAHIGFKFITELNKKKKDFSLANKSFGWKYHLFISLFVYILIGLLIPFREYFNDVFPITIGTAFLYTYTGESMIKNALNKKIN